MAHSRNPYRLEFTELFEICEIEIHLFVEAIVTPGQRATGNEPDDIDEPDTAEIKYTYFSDAADQRSNFVNIAVPKKVEAELEKKAIAQYWDEMQA